VVGPLKDDENQYLSLLMNTWLMNTLAMVFIVSDNECEILINNWDLFLRPIENINNDLPENATIIVLRFLCFRSTLTFNRACKRK